MNVLAIDPGPSFSQILVWDGSRVLRHAHLPNTDARKAILNEFAAGTPHVCIEMVASFGMAVGREVFETCVEIGRIVQLCEDAGLPCRLMPRMEVKMHLCHTARAKDANIRQAILDRFGGKETAIGRKASPGPLFGVKSHAWAALGLALTFAETSKK